MKHVPWYLRMAVITRGCDIEHGFECDWEGEYTNLAAQTAVRQMAAEACGFDLDSF